MQKLHRKGKRHKKSKQGLALGAWALKARPVGCIPG